MEDVGTVVLGIRLHGDGDAGFGGWGYRGGGDGDELWATFLYKTTNIHISTLRITHFN